jgi:hypothetical protein
VTMATSLLSITDLNTAPVDPIRRTGVVPCKWKRRRKAPRPSGRKTL